MPATRLWAPIRRKCFATRGKSCYVESGGSRVSQEDPILLLLRIAWSATVRCGCRACRRWSPAPSATSPMTWCGCSSGFRTPTRNDLKMDDAVMMFYLGLVVFDHVRRRVWIVRNVFTEGEGSLRQNIDAALEHDPRDAQLQARAARWNAHAGRKAAANEDALPCASRLISRAGNFWPQCANPRNTSAPEIFFRWSSASAFRAETAADPFEIYRALRVVNPSPYHVFSEAGRRRHRGQFAGDAGEGAGARSVLPAHRRHASARPRRERGRAASGRTGRRSQGARRTHHAGGPGPQRSGPRLGIRLGARGAAGCSSSAIRT